MIMDHLLQFVIRQIDRKTKLHHGQKVPVYNVMLFAGAGLWHLKFANFVADTCDLVFMT